MSETGPLNTQASDERRAVSTRSRKTKKSGPGNRTKNGAPSLPMVDDEMKRLDKDVIQAEYIQWRKNVQYVYDLVVSHSMEWPSLSVQWFPDYRRENDECTQRLLISSHTSGQGKEYIQIVSVTLPDTVVEAVLEEVEQSGNSRVKVVQEIPPGCEINKASYNPLSYNLIAARTDFPEVLLYDYTRHPTKEENTTPDLVLTGHKKGGYGLSWNPLESNILTSSGEDGIICYFDINKVPLDKKSLGCSGVFDTHTGAVNDVCFSSFNPNVFVSVGDDRSIVIWDRRSSSPRAIENAHTADILCTHLNPLEEFIFATGGSDSTVKIWDMRHTNRPRSTLLFHKNSITQVKWSPHMSSILASSSTDRRVCLWDVSRTSTAQSKDQADEGPPELVFLHGGHTDTISDISWNPLEKWEIASVAEDNVLQIWSRAVDEKSCAWTSDAGR